jgi:galactokinase
VSIERLEPGEPGEIAEALRRELPDALGIFAAPGRVNLIGEHTDYNEGLCLPIALPHATYVAVARRDDDRITVGSRQQDETFESTLGELGPDAIEGWAAYAAGVAWALQDEGIELPGVDLLVDGRVPLGSGLSSSAALECATALALCAAAEVEPDRDLLVRACMRAESEVAGAPTGGMDQSVSLYAEPGHALLLDFRSGDRRQVPWDPPGHALLVVDTRASHELSDGGYGSRRSDCEEAAQALGLDSLRDATEHDLDRLEGRIRARARHIVTEITRVDATVAAITQGDWHRVGELFDESHASMREDFEISTPELDLVVETAREHGALGARMTGGGFGGSAIALMPAEAVAKAEDAIAEAFATRGWDAPASLTAPASAGASQASA